MSPRSPTRSPTSKRPSSSSAGTALLAALLAGYLLAARTAAPLRRFADTAAEVDAGDLSPRLELDPEVTGELRTVADAFNHMLDRLEDAFARQRRFVSDASHCPGV